MASIRALIDAIIDAPVGAKIHLEIEDRREYETVRTRLCKFWNEHKEVIQAIGEDNDPALELGLCGNYDHSTRTAEFYLGVPRRKMAKHYSFTVVQPQDTSSENDTAPTSEEPKVGT